MLYAGFLQSFSQLKPPQLSYNQLQELLMHRTMFPSYIFFSISLERMHVTIQMIRSVATSARL